MSLKISDNREKFPTNGFLEGRSDSFVSAMASILHSAEEAGISFIHCLMMGTGAHIRWDTPPVISDSVQNFIDQEKVGPRKIMRSAGQSVQKFVYATVRPEHVYTPQTKFQCVPLCVN